jgi:hypothetical protein
MRRRRRNGKLEDHCCRREIRAIVLSKLFPSRKNDGRFVFALKSFSSFFRSAFFRLPSLHFLVVVLGRILTVASELALTKLQGRVSPNS